MSDLPPAAGQERPLITTDIEASLQGMMILQLFEGLGDDAMELLLFTYWLGLSVAQIAEQQGKTYKAVESALTRARERLLYFFPESFV